MPKKCNFCNSLDKQLIIKKYKHWTLYIFESQFLLGQSIAVLNRHITFFYQLENKELVELRKVIEDHKKTLDNLFKPDWYNVMQLGNFERHLHLHLVPRYKEARKFDNRVFKDLDWRNMVTNRYKPEDKVFLLKLKNHIQKNLNK